MALAVHCLGVAIPPMSTTTPSLPDAATPALGELGRYVRRPLEAVGFWTAVVLPFLYLPLLADGFTGNDPLAFAGLLALNVVALIAGHGYRRN